MGLGLKPGPFLFVDGCVNGLAVESFVLGVEVEILRPSLSDGLRMTRIGGRAARYIYAGGCFWVSEDSGSG
jgi:hypothetical protein